jgi:hypothetical protein
MTFSTALEGSIKENHYPPKSNKNVAFSDLKHSIHHVEHASNYTEEERQKVWFTRKEFAEIKASYRQILKRMSNRELIPEETSSTRGLEGRSKHGSKNRLSIIMTSILVVLNEQDVQRKQGRIDAETIAILYRHQSYHSLQAAVMMARRDEASVAEYTGRRSQPPSQFTYFSQISSVPSILNLAGSSNFGCPPPLNLELQEDDDAARRRTTDMNPAPSSAAATARMPATTMQRRAAAA